MSADDTPASRSDMLRRKERLHASLCIREMEFEDLPAVFDLGERLFTADKWPNLYRTWDEYNLIQTFAADTETCLVAEFQGALVGFALGTVIDKRRSAWSYGYLLWLGVDPLCARQGVGKRLLNRLTEIFIAQGARIMLVDTEAENRPAVDFFHRHGFGNENRHVYMSKNLTNHPEYLRRRAKSAAQAPRHEVATPRTFPTPGEHQDDEM